MITQYSGKMDSKKVASKKSLIERTSEQNRFICSKCDKVFAFAKNLKRHERAHTDEKPFSCSKCDYKCRSSSDLKKHDERIHSDKKPFSCN